MIEKLNEKMKKLNYPDNHDFDVATMDPKGVLQKRWELIQKNFPELFEKHKSLLDVGSNKGFFDFKLSNNFQEITGYEPAKEIFEFANELKKFYQIKNVEFVLGGFKDISNKSYEVVYVGNVLHYLFRDDILLGNKPLTFLNKLKTITEKYLILEGNFEVKDFAVNALANIHNWDDKIKKAYTFSNFKKKLLPKFKFIRMEYNGIGDGIGKRYTALWEKC